MPLADAVAAQAATGSVRYDISRDPKAGRWYLDASWKTSPAPVPSLDQLRQHPVVAVDVNAGHLAVAVLTPDGNILGTPFSMPLELAGLPASTRDGRVRAAVTALIAIAKQHDVRAIVIEDLNFTAARAEGRERTGNRPVRGKRGRKFRRLVAGIPTAKFRDRLVEGAPMRACEWSRSIPPIPPAGAPSTGSIPCGSITESFPVTTRLQW
jgi:hypothetical protein